MGLSSYLWPTTPLAIGFDDDCGLCQLAKGWVAPLVVARRGITLDSAQAPADPALAAVDPARRLARIHAVADGRVLAGFPAVSALLRRTVVGLPLAPALALMEFTPLGGWAYGAVARRRGASCRPPARRPTAADAHRDQG